MALPEGSVTQPGGNLGVGGATDEQARVVPKEVIDHAAEHGLYHEAWRLELG